MLCSTEGHSRAWWAPIMRKTGLPSSTFAAFVVISMPRTARPSTLGCSRVSGLTRLGVVGRQLVELGVDLVEGAVGRAPARQVRLGDGRGIRLVGRRRLRHRGAQVGVLDPPREAGVAQPLRVGAAVEDDLDALGVTVLGGVEPEAGDLAALLLGRGRHVDDLHLLLGRGRRGDRQAGSTEHDGRGEGPRDGDPPDVGQGSHGLLLIWGVAVHDLPDARPGASTSHLERVPTT